MRVDRYRRSKTFRKISNRLRIGDVAFTVSVGGRRTDGEEQNEGIPASLILESMASWELIGQPGMKRSGK
jgi:hypothetical protein